MITCNSSYRKRGIDMPALGAVRTSWAALPVLTGDVRPQVVDFTVAADARPTAPGPLTWSPPI